MKTFMNIFRKIGGKSESTKEDASRQEQPHGEHSRPEGYQCPMKCEGNKVYESQGQCPVCNMKLMPLK